MIFGCNIKINLGLYKNITKLGLNRVNLPSIYADSILNRHKCAHPLLGLKGLPLNLLAAGVAKKYISEE